MGSWLSSSPPPPPSELHLEGRAIKHYPPDSVRREIQYQLKEACPELSLWKDMADLADKLIARTPREDTPVFELPARKIYRTKTQDNIYQMLWGKAVALSKNSYYGQQGTHAITVIGPKGTGKTRALQTFNVFCGIAFPNIMSVYLTFEGVNRTTLFGTTTIVEALEEQLAEQGITTEEQHPTDLPGGALLRTLKVHKKYLLVMVDEIDVGYKTQDETVSQTFLRTLSELQALGTQGSGRIAVLLCGSSSCLELLIRAETQPSALVTDFPNVKKACNLNGTKFKTWRAPTTTCVDVDTVASMLGLSTTHPFPKIVAYAVGANARDVERYVIDMLSDNLRRDDSSIFSGFSAHNARFGANERGNQLLSELYVAMKRNNIDLLSAAADVDWPKDFKPLKFDEVKTIGTSVGYSGPVHELLYDLYALVDRTFICVDSDDPSQIQVYPHSMLELVCFEHTTKGERESYFEYLRRKVKELGPDPEMSQAFGQIFLGLVNHR